MHKKRKLSDSPTKYLENDYGQNMPIKSKKKNLAGDFEFNSISARVNNYYIKREFKLLELLGDDKDIYDKVLDIPDSEYDEKGIIRKNKKFGFIDPKPLKNRYEIHKKKVHDIELKFYKKNPYLFNSPLNRKIGERLKTPKPNKDIILPDLRKSSSLSVLNDENKFNFIKKICGHEVEIQKNTSKHNNNINLKLRFIRNTAPKVKNHNNKSLGKYIYGKYCSYSINENSDKIEKECEKIQKKTETMEEIRKFNQDGYNKRTKALLNKLYYQMHNY